MTHAHSDIELPPQIAALPRDRRGYPIPYVVLVDADGTPNFVVNDSAKIEIASRDKLCGICGQRLEAEPWFVGGPGAALLNGDFCAYNDGPMHRECMHFALKVCPHLLAEMKGPVNLTPINSKLEAQGITTVSNTTIPGIPVLFVAVKAIRWRFNGRSNNGAYTVAKPVRKTEYWREGVMLPRDEGERAAKKAARELQARLDAEYMERMKPVNARIRREDAAAEMLGDARPR